MSEIHQQIVQLEAHIKDAEEAIKIRDKAVKLSENREFKELILDEYLVKEAARLVQISCDPGLNAEMRADALAMAQSTGHFKRYMSILVQRGNQFERDLEDCRQQLDELRGLAEAE